MKATKRRLFTGPAWGYIGIIVLLACLLCVRPAEAVLTPQSINGTVEMLLAGQQAWTPLTASMKLKAGDQIRTGADGTVDLRFEDDSVLNIARDTQIAISELDVSTPRKTRVARFKLWWGGVTAEVSKLAFDKSAFEVETNTVVAGIKFSKMGVTASKDTSQPNVVTAYQGTIEAKRVAKDSVSSVIIVAWFNEREGLTFPLGIAKVTIRVQGISQEIGVESSAPIGPLQVLGEGKKVLKISNDGAAPVEVNYSGIVAQGGQTQEEKLGLPNAEKLRISSDRSMNVTFSRRDRGAVGCPSGFYVLANKGELQVGEQKIPEGSFECIIPIPAQGRRSLSAPPEEAATRDISQEGVEVWEAPPAPDTNDPEAGSPQATEEEDASPSSPSN